MKRFLTVMLLILLLFTHTAACCTANGSGATQRTGTIGAAGTKTTSTTVKILMYHRLTTDPEKTDSCTVTAGKFEEDLKYLAENKYNVVLPAELTAGGVPADTVVITFDDGYKDFYELAYPLLQKYQMKACVNLICSMPGNNENFLTWDQCREMDASGLVEIGSHTYNLHNPKTGGIYVNGQANGVQRARRESCRQFQTRVLDDIQKSYDVLSAELGHAPATFAYPYGQRGSDSKRLIQSLFRVTLLTSNGYRSLRNNLYNLRRTNVEEKDKLSTLLAD